MAEAADATHEVVLVVMQALEEVIEAELKRGGKINLPLIGSLQVAERAARVGGNPKTGAEVKIPVCRRPVFKPAARLAKLVASGC